MADDETTRFQNDDEWDFESGEVQRPPRSRRSIVSVGFKPDEFQLVAEAARKHDQPVSQFIREAAVQRSRMPRFESSTFIKLKPAVMTSAINEALERAASVNHGRLRAVS